MNRSAIGIIVALIGAIAYGINIPASALTARGGMTGTNLGLLRGVIFVLLIGLAMTAMRRRFYVAPGERVWLVICGISAGLIAACYLSALSYIPVSIAVIVFYLYPLLLILMAALVGLERLTPGRLVAFGLAFAGIVLSVGPAFESLNSFGLLLAFLGAVFCAILFLLAARITADRLAVMFWVQLIALGVLAIVAMREGLTPAAVVADLAWPITIASLGFYVGFICQIVASNRLPPATLGLIFLLEPVVAILSSSRVMNDVISPLQYGGIALVLVGLAYDQLRQGKADPAP
jgi:drug/metabolite transporter (DMT)-like permease